MLKIIVNKCPIDIIKSHNDLKNTLFVNDGDVYNFLNGNAIFLGKSFAMSDIEEIADAIIEQNKKFPSDNIIIHTFNPLFLNFFTDEDAKEYFEYYDKKTNSFKKFFSIERVLNKLDVMGPGEAVCDTDMNYL